MYGVYMRGKCGIIPRVPSLDELESQGTIKPQSRARVGNHGVRKNPQVRGEFECVALLQSVVVKTGCQIENNSQCVCVHLRLPYPPYP